MKRWIVAVMLSSVALVGCGVSSSAETQKSKTTVTRSFEMQARGEFRPHQLVNYVWVEGACYLYMVDFSESGSSLQLLESRNTIDDCEGDSPTRKNEEAK